MSYVIPQGSRLQIRIGGRWYETTARDGDLNVPAADVARINPNGLKELEWDDEGRHYRAPITLITEARDLF